MKIAFDANCLYQQKTGIGNYSYHLIQEISKLNASNDLILFSKRQLRKKKIDQISSLNLKGENIDYKFQPIHNKMFYFLWRGLKIPTTEMFTGKIDITHGVNFLPLPSNNSKKVITIHDSSFILYPEYVAAKTRVAFATQVPKIAKEVDAILTVSNNSKNEIVNLFGVPEEKVHVTYAAASEHFKVLEIDKNIARKKFANGSPYILFVGTLEPRKNIQNLIKAFNNFKKATGHNTKLVLSGKKGWLYDDILKEIEGSRYKDDIVHTGYVDDQDMPLLYNGAELFVYPSFYEGFGIPVLEAMKCGIPVITSNTSSLPEVIGDAGILVDPNEVTELESQIEKVLNSSELRKEMTTKGLEQAKKFTWEQCAKDTLKVYENLIL